MQHIVFSAIMNDEVEHHNSLVAGALHAFNKTLSRESNLHAGAVFAPFYRACPLTDDLVKVGIIAVAESFDRFTVPVNLPSVSRFEVSDTAATNGVKIRRLKRIGASHIQKRQAFLKSKGLSDRVIEKDISKLIASHKKRHKNAVTFIYEKQGQRPIPVNLVMEPISEGVKHSAQNTLGAGQTMLPGQFDIDSDHQRIVMR